MTCPFCPDGSPCSHCYQCNCETYFKLRYCSHLHVAIASNGSHILQRGEAVDAEEDDEEENKESAERREGGGGEGEEADEIMRRTASFRRRQMRRRRLLLQKAK